MYVQPSKKLIKIKINDSLQITHILMKPLILFIKDSS